MTRTCRLCGCTDHRACVTAGVPCHWVAAEICSACVRIPDALVARFEDLGRRIDAAFAPVARFWSDDYGCSAARARQIEDEAYGYEYRDWRRQRWRALRALWAAPRHPGVNGPTGQGDDLVSCTSAKKLLLRCLCTVAILLDRRGGVALQRGLDLAFWGSRSDGYGWSCWVLDFDPLLLRYAAERDGDSFY